MSKPKSVKSAKDILISTDFLQAREKAAKYVNHEFQDYALRLAHDLGDKQNKLIYLKLAKTVERSLLEQAAAFALGYFDEPNKGKIFMWKVQQLRRMKQLKLDMQNFDPNFVLTKTAAQINQLKDLYNAKHKSEFEKSTKEVLEMVVSDQIYQQERTPDKIKVLVVGCGFGYEVRMLSSLGFKVFGTDIATTQIKIAKQICADKQVKLVRKPSFLNNSYKDSYFDVVIVPNSMWQVITLESEPEFIQELARVSKQSTRLYLGVTLESESSQKWSEFEWQEQKYIRFVKSNKLDDLKTTLSSFWQIDHKLAADWVAAGRV